MNEKTQNNGPLGGIFSFTGAIVGAIYGNAIGGNLLVAFVGGMIGAWLGYIVEHIVFRLIVIALALIMIIARQAFFEALRESFSAIETPLTDIYVMAGLSAHDYIVAAALLRGVA